MSLKFKILNNKSPPYRSPWHGTPGERVIATVPRMETVPSCSELTGPGLYSVPGSSWYPHLDDWLIRSVPNGSIR